MSGVWYGDGVWTTDGGPYWKKSSRDECNNKSRCHTPIQVSDEENAMRVICAECKNQYVIRKDPIKGNPEKRSYAKVFKKDILQGNDNLLYKYHPEFLRT